MYPQVISAAPASGTIVVVCTDVYQPICTCADWTRKCNLTLVQILGKVLRGEEIVGVDGRERKCVSIYLCCVIKSVIRDLRLGRI